MKSNELKDKLTQKGFHEEKQDTGFLYTKTVKDIDLISYIEPGISISFTVVYRWSDNFVKGSYTIDNKELELRDLSMEDLFKSTLNDMPAYVGEKDIHEEVKQIVEHLFGEDKE